MVFYFTLIADVLLALVLLFPFISGIIAILKGQVQPVTNATQPVDFACVITGYKDVTIAQTLVKSLINQIHINKHIYLVADACDQIPFQIIHPQFTCIQPPVHLNSKVKSVLAATGTFVRPHEAIIIFDPDNIAHPHFLEKMSNRYRQGYVAVQGRRTAKNLDTPIACLDAAGEFYYNFTTRKVPFALGSSATIAGSGMAVQTNLFKAILNQTEEEEKAGKVVIAEDKILQMEIVAAGNIIAYEPEAIVYDEKTSKSNALQRQRTRWISSYFRHLDHGTSLLRKSIQHRSFNQFYFSGLLLFPPMFILMLAAFVCSMVSFFVGIEVFYLVFGASILFVLNFLLVLKIEKVPSRMFGALLFAPVFMFRQTIALFQMRKTRKDFLVTTHSGTITIDEINPNS